MRISRLVDRYFRAKQLVIERGYAEEIFWQQRVSLWAVTETRFLREAAWVVLSSGFREATLRRKFDGISEAFLNWTSARDIGQARDSCIERARGIFNHQKKLEAIGDICVHVSVRGFQAIKMDLLENGVSSLEHLPFVGPITKFHLAKNLGMQVVKPDRHLVRMSEEAGMLSPEALCKLISDAMGDSVDVVDTVLWRYATLVKDAQLLFARPTRSAPTAGTDRRRQRVGNSTSGRE